MSCNFMPCYLVRHFHVLQFHALLLGPSFSCPAISCPAILGPSFSCPAISCPSFSAPPNKPYCTHTITVLLMTTTCKRQENVCLDASTQYATITWRLRPYLVIGVFRVWAWSLDLKLKPGVKSVPRENPVNQFELSVTLHHTVTSTVASAMQHASG